MNFVSLRTPAALLLVLLRKFPEGWHTDDVWGPLQSLIGFMHGRNESLLLNYTQQLSIALGNGYVKKVLGANAPSLVNAFLDCETQTLSIKIPTGDEYYTISIREAGMFEKAKMFELDLFHPTKGSMAWYGTLASFLTYKRHMGGDLRVLVDGERISIRAWNAICAHAVALKTDSYTLLWDMARDGEL